MSTPYLVLKRLPSVTRDVFAGAPIGPSMATMGKPIPPASVGVAVTAAVLLDVPAISAQPDTVAVAPVVPMKLIAPVERKAEAADDDAAPDLPTSAWGLHAIGADTTTLTGEGVVVAVVDTGIDADHPAFAGVELIQADFTGEGLGDDNGHGTHCAGTIFGRPVKGMPIGIAPGVTRAVIAKVLGADGGGSSESIVKGILWAIEQGAHVISMSIGMDFPGIVAQMVERQMPPELATSRALEAYRSNTRLFDNLAGMVASGALAAQSTVVIAAAGNESRREVHPDFEIAVAPPALSEGFVSVGALGLVEGKYQIADFSNTGPNLSGPGVDIVSAARGGGLAMMSGTSMATPHVAGAAVLWAEKLMRTGALSQFQLVSKLGGTASDEMLIENSQALDYGAGMVQCPRK